MLGIALAKGTTAGEIATVAVPILSVDGNVTPDQMETVAAVVRSLNRALEAANAPAVIRTWNAEDTEESVNGDG